jgi:hypothetical protein
VSTGAENKTWLEQLHVQRQGRVKTNPTHTCSNKLAFNPVDVCTGNRICLEGFQVDGNLVEFGKHVRVEGPIGGSGSTAGVCP